MKGPTAAQLCALRDYAGWAGDNWKSELSHDWMRAGSEWSGPYELLHQLRNTLGPSWLKRFDPPTLWQCVLATDESNRGRQQS